MNESDFIRQQLSAERSHLHHILEGLKNAPEGVCRSDAVGAYTQWAVPRLISQLSAHHAAVRTASVPEDLAPQLAGLAHALEAADGAQPPQQLRIAALLQLLEAWNAQLDALAARTLRVGHWRNAAQLSADTVLQERRLYSAARAALGLP